MKNCKNCKFRLNQGEHKLAKCSLTGLEITDPGGCLAWREKND